MSSSDEQYAPAITTINGSVDKLVQIQSFHGSLTILDDDVSNKIAAAIAAQEHVNISSRRNIKLVRETLVLIKSRSVLYAEVDYETWPAVFRSLQDFRDAFAYLSVSLKPSDPESIRSLVDLLLTVTRNYISEWEFRHGAYRTKRAHMLSLFDRDGGNWPDRWREQREAGRKLLELREIIQAAVEPLESYMNGIEDLMRNKPS